MILRICDCFCQSLYAVTKRSSFLRAVFTIVEAWLFGFVSILNFRRVWVGLGFILAGFWPWYLMDFMRFWGFCRPHFFSDWKWSYCFYLNCRSFLWLRHACLLVHSKGCWTCRFCETFPLVIMPFTQTHHTVANFLQSCCWFCCYAWWGLTVQAV